MSVTIAHEEIVSVRWDRLGLEGVGALVVLCGWSDGQLTDGEVPDEAVVLRMVPRRALTKLVDLGELRRTPTGYQIVHFDRYCDRKSRVIARREFERDRKRRQRNGEQGSESDTPCRPVFVGAVPVGLPVGVPRDMGSGTPGGSHAGVPAPAPARPVPSHPNPARAVPSPETTGTADGGLVDLLRRELGERAGDVTGLDDLAALASGATSPRDTIVAAVRDVLAAHNVRSVGGVLRHRIATLAKDPAATAKLLGQHETHLESLDRTIVLPDLTERPATPPPQPISDEQAKAIRERWQRSRRPDWERPREPTPLADVLPAAIREPGDDGDESDAFDDSEQGEWP